MLKSHLIKTKGESSIYYKDNTERTINLENCIKLVFTNDKDPLRLNLEKIIELRNTSTHFITEEYEMVYVPLFQSCIFNFSEKMAQFHNFDITNLISLNFLNLVVKEKSLDENEIKAKYSDKIAHKLIGLNDKISKTTEEYNSKYAIIIRHDYYLTKDKTKSTDTVAIDKNSNNKIKIVKELKDPNETHKYKTKDLISIIDKRLKKENINLRCKDNYIVKFNFYHFGLFRDYYNIKNNKKLCYAYKTNTGYLYSYSSQAIDFIYDEIKKDPENILNNIKNKLKK